MSNRCYRCGNPANQSWNICADGNKVRCVCTECDIELNEMVLKFFGFKQWESKMKRYKIKMRGENMEPNDMLTAVVQVMVEGGGLDIMYLHSIKATPCNGVIIHHMDKYKDDNEDAYSLPDLLADSSAMKAAYGEETYCVVAGGLYCTTCLLKSGTCGICSRIPNGQPLPAWQYHALEAMKILHKGEDAVKYLYNNLLKGEKG